MFITVQVVGLTNFSLEAKIDVGCPFTSDVGCHLSIKRWMSFLNQTLDVWPDVRIFLNEMNPEIAEKLQLKITPQLLYN